MNLKLITASIIITLWVAASVFAQQSAPLESNEKRAALTEPAATSFLAQEALEQLPAEDANLLRLKYYDGWTVEEIAAQNGGTPKAIENRLARLRERLREIILRIQ